MDKNVCPKNKTIIMIYKILNFIMKISNKKSTAEQTTQNIPMVICLYYYMLIITTSKLFFNYTI